jgi:hypothetical protein
MPRPSLGEKTLASSMTSVGEVRTEKVVDFDFCVLWPTIYTMSDPTPVLTARPSQTIRTLTRVDQ